MSRKALSKKQRFEVFKRDAFTCQYCGRKAPEVVLQCDHVDPVAGGGSNDVLNLVTSCADCNAGKGARSLSDQSALSKQVDQLAELQERREQIEMMIEWRKGLSAVQQDAVEGAAARWHELTEEQWTLSKTGKDRLKKIIKEFGFDLVLQAMGESLDTYGRRNAEQKLTDESIDKAWSKLAGVARVIRDSAEKPYLKRIFYIRGILRGRLSYLDDREALALMESAAKLNVDFDSVEAIARRVTSWSRFRDTIIEYIDKHKGADE